REFFDFKHLADLSLGAVFEGSAFEPLDSFFFRLHLPNPEAGDQFLGFGEWAVGNDSLVAGELYAGALGARVQPLSRQHHAGLHEFFVEPGHLLKDLLAGESAGFRFFACLDNHHESHRYSPRLRLDSGTASHRRQSIQFKYGPDLDGPLFGAGNTSGGVDRLVEIRRLDQEKAAELFTRFGELAVGDLAFAVTKPNAGRGR